MPTSTAIGACAGISQPAVEDFLVKKLGLAKQSFVFHVGWFQDTVPRSLDTIRSDRFAEIDGDWYDSTKVCIETLYDRVVRDGFIIIDDYGTFSGCRRGRRRVLRERGTAPLIQRSDQVAFTSESPDSAPGEWPRTSLLAREASSARAVWRPSPCRVFPERLVCYRAPSGYPNNRNIPG